MKSWELARRDFVRMYGHKAIEKMDLMEKINKEQPFLEKYWDEIEKYGLDRLMIKKDEKQFSDLDTSKIN